MASQRQKEAVEKWILAEDFIFKDNHAKKRYQTNLQRFVDSVFLEKQPDRVPVFITGTFLVPNLYGLSPYEAMYDYEAVIEAHIRFLRDFDPDYALTPTTIGSGKVLEIIGFKQYRWPGHGVPSTSVYQYVERPYMEDHEYEILINDPSDFWLRCYLPRVCEVFEPFAKIPPLTDLWEIINYTPFFSAFGIDEVQKALNKLSEAGKEAKSWVEKVKSFSLEAKALGYPVLVGGTTKAPFDLIADTLRGTKGALIDMYKRPDLLQKALERLTPIAILQGIRGARASGNPVVFIPLHKGSDEFMSDRQFKTFYWPTLRTLIEGLVEEGCIPYVFAEGSFNSRLDYLKELPKASCFWRFERTDMAEAKKKVGDWVCISGNVPPAILMHGSPQEVKDYCKRLIDTCAAGGGFILSPASTLDEARPENIKAMIEICREYKG